MLESELLNLLSVGDIVPEVYARYRPVVADGLGFFLENLPGARRAAILHEQAALPVDTPPAERLAALMHQGPTLHKLGQVLARHRALDPGIRGALVQLESRTPVALPAIAGDLLQRELGGAAAAGLTIGCAPLAEASVAIVVPCQWHERAEPPRDGVIKLLRPGIVDRLAEDLEAWSRLGAFLDDRVEHYGLPALDYGETLRQVRDLLTAEVCFRREQAHLAAAREAFASEPGVVVPRVWPFSTDRATVMDFVAGRKVTEVEHLAPARRRSLASAVVEHLLAAPFTAPGNESLFHGDPHAGNILCDDGRLGLIDWAQVGRLRRQDRERLAQLVLAGVSADRPRLAAALAAVSTRGADHAALAGVVDRAMLRLVRGSLAGARWLCATLDDAAGSGAVCFSEDFLLLRKVMSVIDGVAADISVEIDLDLVLIARVMRSLAAEWPTRMSNPFAPASTGVPVSTAELMALAAGGPLAAARWWMEWWRLR